MGRDWFKIVVVADTGLDGTITLEIPDSGLDPYSGRNPEAAVEELKGLTLPAVAGRGFSERGFEITTAEDGRIIELRATIELKKFLVFWERFTKKHSKTSNHIGQHHQFIVDQIVPQLVEPALSALGTAIRKSDPCDRTEGTSFGGLPPPARVRF